MSILKYSIRIIILTAVINLLTGCTRNNGDIGPWFGTWKLDEITIDGNVSEEYDGNVFWKFHNNVFEMVKMMTDDKGHGYGTCFATWSEADGYLIIDFRQHDDQYNPEDWNGLYRPFLETHLPVNGVADIKIVKLSGSKAQLTYYSSEDGKTYGYTLSKYG